MEVILGRDPEQSDSGRVGPSLEHESSLFHTWHKPLVVLGGVMPTRFCCCLSLNLVYPLTEPSTPLERDTHPFQSPWYLSRIPRGVSQHILPEESKLVISLPEGPLVLVCCGVNRLIGSLSRVARFIVVRQCERVVCEYSTSLAWDLLLRVFCFLFQISVALLKLWEVEDYTDLGTPCPRNLTIT